MRLRVLGLLTAVLPAVCAPAFAAGEFSTTAALAAARDPSGQRAAALTDALLRARVARSKTLRLIEPARALSGDPRTREEEILERARTAFQDGRRAYDSLSLDDAVARLGQAVSLFTQTGPLLGDCEELENALIYLGAAVTLRGAPETGETTFLELLTIDPSHQIDGFPPAVMKVFESALKKIEAAPTGGVEIYSTPPYAAVYLDGRFEGVTPLTLADVTAGTHQLRIEKTGFTTHGAPLAIAPGRKITSQTRLRNIKGGTELRELTTLATGEVSGEGMGGSLRTLTRMLSAETLIFASVTQSGNDATLIGGVFDSATGTRLGTERAVLAINAPSFASELDQFVMRLIVTAERGSPGKESTPTPTVGGGFGFAEGASSAPPKAAPAPAPSTGTRVAPADGNRPVAIVKLGEDTPTETYLGWTLIGVGGAAAVAGIVTGIVASSFHSDFRNTSQLSPDLETLRTDGKRMSLIADGCFLGAALSAAVGVTFLLIASPDQPTPEEVLRTPTLSLNRAGVAMQDGGALFTVGATWR